MFSGEAPARRGGTGSVAELACVAVVAAVISFAGIGSHSLWTPDEPRDAALGRTMLVSRDWIIPRLNGQPFLEKPPLTWWLQAAAYRTLGVSDAVARVPSALCATLTLLVTFALGKRLGGRSRTGWLAAGVLASTAEFGEDMRRAIVDPPMVLMVALAYAGFAVLAAPRARRAAAAAGGGFAFEIWRARWLIVFAVALAFLAKGMVGLALAAGPPVAWLLASAFAPRPGRSHGAAGGDDAAASRRTWGWREAARQLGPLALLGVPVFAAFTLPWAMALVHEGGWAALRECLVGNTLGRLFPTEAGRVYGHRLPFWYYLPAGAAVLLPWTLALPAVLRGQARTLRGVHPSEEIDTGPGAAPTRDLDASADVPRRLLVACFFLGTLLLSVAASKRTVYLVPLLPALAVPIGLWLDGLGDAPTRSRWDRPTALLLLALAACLPAVLWIAAWEAGRGAFHSFPAAPLFAELTAGRLGLAAAVAAAGAMVLLRRFARHLRAGTTPSGPWLVVPYLALTLAYHTAVKAVIDPLKNPHDLTAAIARLDPGPGPVAAYRPSETTLGIVELDLGRRVQPVAGPADLATLLATRPDLRLVLSLDAWHRLPPPLQSRLRLVYDESATKASPFAIVAPAATSARRPDDPPVSHP